MTKIPLNIDENDKDILIISFKIETKNEFESFLQNGKSFLKSTMFFNVCSSNYFVYHFTH